MENVLTAAFVIFLLLFALLTLTAVIVDAQESMQVSLREAEARQAEWLHSDLQAVGGQVAPGGSQIEITLRNSGDTRLADYDRWDLVYQSSGSNAMLRWLPYAASPGLDQWGVTGLYLDAASAIPEAHEVAIWNPGEEIVLRLVLSQPLEEEAVALVAIATANGARTSLQIMR